MALLRFLLDTNMCILLFEEVHGAVRAAYRESRLAGDEHSISSVTSFELSYGAAKSAYPHFGYGRLQDFLERGVSVLPLEHEDALAAGVIRTALERRKQPIGPYDTLIAGQAVARRMTLVTTNVREFARVEGLVWVDWSQG